MHQLRHAAAQGGDSSTLVAAEQQLARLAGLQQHLSQGGNLDLLQTAIRASVDAAQALVPQARTATTTGHAAELALHQAVAHARQVTGDFVHDFYERRIFDPYLSFATPEEEQAYRDREETRQRAIEAARALGTPEGDLLALQLSEEQLNDAARYGADRSPDFAPTYDRVSRAGDDLERSLGIAPQQARADHANAQAEPHELVCPDIVASLRNAGVSVPDADATPCVIANRLNDCSRSLS